MPDAKPAARPGVQRWLPLILALVAAAAMVAAILAYFLTSDDEADAGSRAFTAEETNALSAAKVEVANLSSFRRAHFEADFQRALNGLTGSKLISDIKANKATTQKTLNAGKFDLSAKVTHAALVGPVDDDKVQGYVALISLNGFRSTQQNQPTPQNLRVTVVKKDGKYLLSQVDSIQVTQ